MFFSKAATAEFNIAENAAPAGPNNEDSCPTAPPISLRLAAPELAALDKANEEDTNVLSTLLMLPLA
jgi:hypothetical protein